MMCKKLIQLFCALLFVATLCGCAALGESTSRIHDTKAQTVAEPGQISAPTEQAGTEQDLVSAPTEQIVEATQNDHGVRVNRFLRNFSTDYPEYRLLEYIIGSEENDPILLVAIAENQETTASSTLFFVDEGGVGIVTLASDRYASYREEDGFRLEGNGVSFSLNVECDTGFEIHDYTVTADKNEDDSLSGYGMVYANHETIREQQ